MSAPVSPGWYLDGNNTMRFWDGSVWTEHVAAPIAGQWTDAPAYGVRPGERRKIDGFAITSLITGVIGGVIFSVGFGIAALLRIRRGERRGRGLAVAGLTMSLIWVVAIGVVIAYQAGRRPDRSASGDITHQGQMPPGDLRAGDCVEVPRVLTGTYSTVTVLPCSQSHNGQVFAVLQASAGAYPGAAAIQDAALADCKAAEPAFLGTDQTPLHVVAYFASEKSWRSGDRGETCLLVDRAKDITGDIRSDR